MDSQWKATAVPQQNIQEHVAFQKSPSDNDMDMNRFKSDLLTDPLSGSDAKPEDIDYSQAMSPQINQKLQGLDLVFAELGRPGKFVAAQILLINLMYIPMAFPLLSYVFIGYAQPHRCAGLVNETFILNKFSLYNDTHAYLQYDKCTIHIVSNLSGEATTISSMNRINGYDFGSVKHTSFVSEWGLVCEHKTLLSELAQSGVMFGQLIGSVTLPPLADRFGRKPVLTVCLMAVSALGLCTSYAPNLIVLIVLQVVSGFFVNGLIIVGFTLMMEWMMPEYRRMIGILASSFWMSSLCLLALFAYLLRDYSWRAMPIVSAVLGLVGLLYPFFLSESPRWLTVNKKHSKSLVVFKRACRLGGKDFERVKDVYVNAVQQDSETDDDKEAAGIQPAKQQNFFDILKHKRLLIRSVILCIVWVTTTTTYYGLFLVSSNLAGDRYINFICMSLVVMPGEIVGVILTERLGRKILIMGLLCLTGISLLVASLLIASGTDDITQTLGTVFSFIGKFGIGPCFTAIYVYTPEVFPTNLRSTGLGVCNGLARIGGIVAPYSSALATVALWAPGSIFSGMCFLSAALMSVLPETKGKALPNTIEDLRKMSKKNDKNRSIELKDKLGK